MRLAVAGKGGAGKTTIAATLARLHAANGVMVVTVDGDSNPNLALALGIPEASPAPLPPSLVSRRLEGPALTAPLSEVLERHGTAGPDGMRVLAMGHPGHAEEGCLCAAHATVSAVLADLGSRPDVLAVIDMEASPEHLSRGTTRHADVLLLVAEPYFRALESVRRLAVLASELPISRVAVVANKVRSDEDEQAIAEYCERHSLELAGSVPWDDAVGDADHRRVALADAAPTSAAVAAIAELGERLGLGPVVVREPLT